MWHHLTREQLHVLHGFVVRHVADAAAAGSTLRRR